MDGSYHLGALPGRRGRCTGREMERIAGPEGKMVELVEGIILFKF